MKKIFLIILFVSIASIAFADTITLNLPETIDTPTAVKIDWYIDYINAGKKLMKIKWRWVDANSNPIRHSDSSASWRTWTCTNIDDNPETPQDETDHCFSGVFSFKIRQQDVGTSIGIGLRTLMWNRMKSDILTPGNNGAFEQ